MYTYYLRLKKTKQKNYRRHRFECKTADVAGIYNGRHTVRRKKICEQKIEPESSSR